MDWQTVAAELEKPLDKRHVRPAQKFGPKGDYLEGWHVIAEANRIFGPGNWAREMAECRCVMERERTIGKPPNEKPGWGVSYIARARVTVAGVVREGTGAGHGVDADLGQAHESAIKEAETDAMKRALMTFGNPFGLALYDKSRENVADTAGQEAGAQAFAKAVNAAIARIAKADSFEALKAAWEDLYLNQAEVSDDPRVIKAKDDRKAALQGEMRGAA